MKRLSYHSMRTILIVTAIFFIITGCSSSKMNQSGWLKDYSKLEKGPKDGVDYVYTKPGFDFKKYNKVKIDKVAFYFKQDSGTVGIQPDILKELSDTFEKELVANINDAYPMVDQKGPGVLRIRIAITDVEASNPVLGTVGAVLPVGIAANLISNATRGKSVNVGSASIEAEFLDSMSGELLVSLVDNKTGSTYDTASVKGEWGHAKKAFQEWAKLLRARLDEAHGK